MITSSEAITETRLEWFRRRISLSGNTLSIPMVAINDESLEDLLLRSAAENGYFDVKAILSALGASNSRAQGRLAPQPHRWVNRDTLNDVLGMDVHELRPPLERPVRRGERTFFGSKIRECHLTSQLRVSPLGLREKVYYRAVWRVRPLTFDPMTREELLDKCPECKRGLNGRFTIGLQFCWNCRFRDSKDSINFVDFRDYPQPLVQVDDEEALNFATWLIDPRVYGDIWRSDRLHEDLCSLERGEVFHLITVLGKQLSIVEDEAVSRWTSAPIAPTVLAYAARVVLDWPCGFKNLVSRIRASQKCDEKAKVKALFKSHGFPAQFLRSLFRHVNDERLDFRANSALQRAVPTVSSSANAFGRIMAAKTTRSPRSQFHTLTSVLECGLDQIGTAQVQLTALLQKSGVQSLADKIGVPAYELQTMVEADLLPASVMDRLDRKPVGNAFATLAERVMSRRSMKPVPTGCFPLSNVIAAFSLRLHQPWSELLRAAALGEFEFWVCGNPARSIFRVMHVRDLDRIHSLIASAPPSDEGLRSVYVSNKDAAPTLNVPLASVADFARFGALQPPPTVGDINRVRKTYILPSEISPRLASMGEAPVSPQAVARELRNAGFPSLDKRPLAIRFRADVETYFGNRIRPCLFD